MLSSIYLLTISALATFSFTRKRIFVLSGFYCIYGFLKILGLNENIDLGALSMFRALYVILPISMIARLIQDHSFVPQVRRWPLVPYFFLLATILASSLYSSSNKPFSSDYSANLWSHLVVVLLFCMTAASVQDKNDLKIFAGATVLVSLSLSVWVIWNAARLNFEAFRGGVDVNQNFISEFALPGALPLIYVIFTDRRWFLKFFCLPVLLCIILAGLILASLGMLAALVTGASFMFGGLFRALRPKTILVFGIALVLVVATAFLLPGSQQFLSRFHGSDLGTLDERTLIWSQSLKYYTDSGLSRMVFGHGMSSGDFVISPVLPDYVNYHNEYLMWLLDVGVVGVIALLVFLCSVARRLLSYDHPAKNLMIGWLAFLAVAGLSSTISDLHSFWILLGIIVGVTSLEKNSRSSHQLAMAGNSRTPACTFPAPRTTGGL
jgi:O-antigen ligase